MPNARNTLSKRVAHDTGTSRRWRGFTLIELIAAIVILSAAVTGVMFVFTRIAGSSADPLVRVQARSIAEAYMDEILLKAYSDPDGSENGTSGPEEASRSLYDDVWDYDTIDGESPTTQLGGVADAALSDYSVAVDVTGNPAGNGPASIVVTVTHASGNTAYSLESERRRLAP